MADSATYDPSWLIRWPMIAPAVKGITLPGGTSSHRATRDHSPLTSVSSRAGRAGGLAAAEVDETALGSVSRPTANPAAPAARAPALAARAWRRESRLAGWVEAARTRAAR